MPRTARYTLSTTPVQVDVAADDSIAMRSLLIVAQGDGTVVICEDADSYATGTRIPVSAGDAIPFDRLQGNEDVWLAAPSALDVDVLETGVA